MVAPSPPSPRSPGRHSRTSGWRARSSPHRIAQGARPVAVDDGHATGAGRGRLVEVGVEELQRLVHARAAQVQARRDGATEPLASGDHVAGDAALRHGGARPVARSRRVVRSSGAPPAPSAWPRRAGRPSTGTSSSRSTSTRAPPASSVARPRTSSSAATVPTQPTGRGALAQPPRARLARREAHGHLARHWG